MFEDVEDWTEEVWGVRRGIASLARVKRRDGQEVHRDDDGLCSAPVLHCPQKKNWYYCLKSRQHGQWKHVAVFFRRSFRFSAQASTVPCGPKLGRPDNMSSLMHSRERAKAKALKFENMVPGAWIFGFLYYCSQVFFSVEEWERRMYSLRLPGSFYTAEKTFLATTAQETKKSSAWNYIFKLERPGPPRRKTRKVLSVWHTHGSVPRSS